MFLPPSDIRSKAVLLNCFHLRNFTSLVDYTLKINMEHVLMEVWFRSFSFLDGWFAGSMVIFQSVMVNRWFWAPVVWDSNRDTPKLRVPFIFGDRSNPNYRAPNHQLTISWFRLLAENDLPWNDTELIPFKILMLGRWTFSFQGGYVLAICGKRKETKRKMWGYDMSNVR